MLHRMGQLGRGAARVVCTHRTQRDQAAARARRVRDGSSKGGSVFRLPVAHGTVVPDIKHAGRYWLWRHVVCARHLAGGRLHPRARQPNQQQHYSGGRRGCHFPELKREFSDIGGTNTSQLYVYTKRTARGSYTCTGWPRVAWIVRCPRDHSGGLRGAHGTMALRSVLSAGLRVARARVCTGEPALRASTARTARLSSVASRSLHSGSVSDAGAADGSGEAPAHHNPKGGFRNPWPSYHDHGLGDIVRMLGDWDRLVRPKRLAVQPPDFEALANPPETGVQATWIGHATFVVQMDGFSFITDPVFSHRASAVSFVGPARYTPVPCAIADLPPLDFALISHK